MHYVVIFIETLCTLCEQSSILKLNYDISRVGISYISLRYGDLMNTFDVPK